MCREHTLWGRVHTPSTPYLPPGETCHEEVTGCRGLARRANITPMDHHGPVVPENLAQIIPHGPDEPGPALGPHSQGRDVALPGSI